MPLLLAAALAGVIAPGLAEAQTERVRRAASLGAAGDHHAAIRVLREAQVEEPSPRVDINLALELAEIDQLREARRLLRRVIAGDANPLLVDAAREHLREVDAQLPALTVQVDGDAAAVRVGRQTAAVDGPSVRLELDPGAHRVELVDDRGEVVAETEVILRRAHTEEIRLAPAATPPGIGGASAGTEGGVAVELPEGRRAASSPTATRRAVEAPSSPASVASPREAAVAATATADSTSIDGTTASGDDPLPWIVAGGVAAAVITAVIVIAVVAAQPQGTTSDLPPVVLGGP